jgi:hypothetical protein
MTCITRRMWTATLAAVFMTSAAVASGQSGHVGHAAGSAPSASQPVQTPRNALSMTMMHKDLLGRMAAEDARLKALVADMNVMTGDLKVEAIARVVTLLVEQRLATRQQVRTMHEQMMGNMTRATTDTPEETASDLAGSTDAEPAEMCLPPTN